MTRVSGFQLKSGCSSGGGFQPWSRSSLQVVVPGGRVGVGMAVDVAVGVADEARGGEVDGAGVGWVEPSDSVEQALRSATAAANPAIARMAAAAEVTCRQLRAG
ncbi:hypothetical protein GCM10022263_37230 [Nocardioides daeguensis]|uniref:Uncharacterized protein n=1 Tax=Nocardioides daeguensis TaxID=908359 RepID=A0ABP6W5X1_9ACTN